MGIFDSLFKPNVEKLKAKGDVKGLIRAIKSEDVHVRRRAAEVLGEIGAANAVDSLVATLIHDDEDVRLCAAEVLEKMNFEARNEFEQILLLIAKRRGNDLVKFPVSSLIKPIIDPASIYPKIEADPSDYMANLFSIYVMAALWEIGKPAVPSLIAVVEDRNRACSCRCFGCVALGAIADPQSIEPLMIILRDRTEDMYVRENAVLALMCMGKQVLEPMLAVLRDKDADVYGLAAACQILMTIGKPAIEGLIRALEDERYKVRSFATIALAGIGDPCVIESLHSMKTDRNKEVRKNALFLLQEIGNPSVDSYRSLLFHYDNVCKQVAAAALGNIGDSRAVEDLALATYHEDLMAQAFALHSLAKMISEPKARAILIGALREKPSTISSDVVKFRRCFAALFLLSSGVPVLRHL